MVRRSIISFNNAILVFIDRDKNWVWKVKKREVKVLYHLSCGYLVLLFHHPDIPSQWSNLRSDPKVIQAHKWLCCVLSCSVMSDSLWPPWTVAHQAPLSMGILQASILDEVSMLSSRGSSWPRNQTEVSCIASKFFTSWATREAHICGYWQSNDWKQIIEMPILTQG